MDRRSWLWRRRTSDKSPGETDSSGSGSGSGSISSPSERFSDEQQPYSIQNAQSPEVTSKVGSRDEDVNDSVKILSEKLSDALASVNAKEELVKQHAKVAEEAVTGWEKAEEEVVTLKQQLEVATTKNKSLEERVVHLDGALKECLRQSRLVKEEYVQKIQEAVSKRSHDTGSINTEFENQLSDLRAQLETAKAKADAATSSESDLRLRLDFIMKENESLQLELRSRLQDLEITTLERDLSTKTAETASKQHLESIKKVAKLEAECRRLKTLAGKATSFSENQSFVAAPTHVDSHTEKSINCNALSAEIGLMDDFLEMEKFAALPVQENRSSSLGSVISADKLHGIGDDSLRAEFEVMLKRTVKLEEKVAALESEKVELGSTLTRCEDQIKMSETRTMQLQSRLNECQNQLKISQAQLSDANKKLAMLQAELDLANELRQAIELELEDANLSREEGRSKLRVIEDESEILLSKIDSLESEAEKERSLYAEASSKCRTLEDELSRMKHENSSKEMTELQLEAAHSEIESLTAKISALENEAEMERRVCLESAAKCRKLEGELSRMKHKNAKKETIESELEVAQSELKSLTDKISALESEAELERRWSSESATKCRKLEDELSRMKHEIDIQKSQHVSVNDSKEAEVKSLMDKISALENESVMERWVSAESSSKCRQLEDELSRMKHEAETWKTQLDSVSRSKEAVELELKTTNAIRQEVESQLVAAHDEAKSLLAKVCSLEGEVKKERAVSSEFVAQCKTLENELLKIKSDADLRLVPLSKEELNTNQDKEMAIAATKLAECQKTIASLGHQLKTLASFDDLFLDSDNLTEIDAELPRSSKLIVQSDSDSVESKTVKDVKEGLSSSSTTVVKSHKNGFGKLFFQSKGVMRSQIS